MSHVIDKNYFPGFTRKALSFTIDDGWIRHDRHFLSIVNPAGLRGSFNLCGHTLNQLTPEEYLAFYKGHGITNHTNNHPLCLDPSVGYVIGEGPFDEATADEKKIYPSKSEGYYMIHLPQGWREACDRERYFEAIDDGKRNIEKIFGDGCITEFVWPYCEQNDPVVYEYLKKNYRSIRTVVETGNSTGFALPADRMRWVYTATVPTMDDLGAEYDALPDDGKLHFFAFGVHSYDFERVGRWDVLERFAARFGHREAEYFYAPIGEIFDYEDAIGALKVTDTALENPTDLPLYVTVDGTRHILKAHSTLNLD